MKTGRSSLNGVVVKIGTSTIAPSGGPPDADFIQNLAGQIACLMNEGTSVIVVSSGAIRAGMGELLLKDRNSLTLPQKQAAAAVGQGRLMHMYSEAFAGHHRQVAQLLLTRDDFRSRIRYLNARNTIDALLDFGVVPIVNENDTVSVDEIRFGDNDTLAAQVASLANAQTLLLLTRVDGLFDRFPPTDPDAKVIRLVEKVDESIQRLAGPTNDDIGTGGMRTKLEAAKICSRSSVTMVIAHGRADNVIKKAIAGEIGTTFLPRPGKALRSRQRWIAFGASPKGVVTVNDGAKNQLLTGGKSLLAAGITSVTGQFQRGDLVQVSDADGAVFAQGFVNYSHASLVRIIGKQSSDIAKVLGEKVADEVVHRDNMVFGP